MHGLRVTYAIWLREVKLFVRERSRIIGMIGQPLLYLLILGQGIAHSMKIDGAPTDLNYLTFMYPGILGMSALFTSMFSAISIIWDREFGFLKEVLVAPAPRWAVAVGKVLGGATVATMQSALLLLLSPVAGVWPTPALLLLLPLCFLMSVAMTSLGVAIAARMRSMQGFQMIMNFLVMPLYFLSGAMFPLTGAPDWMKPLMWANPLSYGVDALRIVVFWGVPGGELKLIFGNLLLDVGVLLGVAAALALVAAFRFNRAD
jgi:ABC-2 type transport system permease protein